MVMTDTQVLDGLYSRRGRNVSPPRVGDPSKSADMISFIYGFPDPEGSFSIPLLPGRYRVFTESLGPSVQSVSDGSRDITNTEFILESGTNQQIIVTLAP